MTCAVALVEHGAGAVLSVEVWVRPSVFGMGTNGRLTPTVIVVVGPLVGNGQMGHMGRAADPVGTLGLVRRSMFGIEIDLIRRNDHNVAVDHIGNVRLSPRIVLDGRHRPKR